MNIWTCSVACNDNKATARSIQFDANDVIIITAPLRLSKKLRSLPSSVRQIIGPTPTGDPWPSRREIYGNSLPVSPLIKRLSVRVDRLEDAISHVYNVINELHRRVSTLENKLKPLAKDELHYGAYSLNAQIAAPAFVQKIVIDDGARGLHPLPAV